jgi:MoaA/NifB/PqqE/SkfB family radical SAM enzyme
LLDAATKALYARPSRKVIPFLLDRILRSPGPSAHRSPTGWRKIRAQRRSIYLAIGHTLNRAIEQGALSPHVARVILERWSAAVMPSRARRAAVRRFRDTHGSDPPWFVVISPTRACNLACRGCYAAAGTDGVDHHGAHLPWDVLDRAMMEAKELWGVPLFVFSGGEPLAYRSQGHDLLDIVEKHRDCLFLMFTNGTLIDEATADRLATLGNLTPALSVEGMRDRTDCRRGVGTYDRVLDAMARLRAVGVPFGISVTATRSNAEEILSDPILDFYVNEQSAFYLFVFQYMPLGRAPDLEWMPTPAQRVTYWRRSWEIVRERHIFLLDFWNHGPLVEGCIAAGREKGYVHIDWDGKVMPCVFMPYAAADLQEIYARGGTLNDVWATPFFQAIREWQRDNGYGQRELSREGNWMQPCPFRDHLPTFQTWIERFEPEPEEGVACPGLLSGPLRARMLAYETAQAQVTLPLWEKEYL